MCIYIYLYVYIYIRGVTVHKIPSSVRYNAMGVSMFSIRGGRAIGYIAMDIKQARVCTRVCTRANLAQDLSW